EDEFLSADGDCVYLDPDRVPELPPEAEGLPECTLAAPSNRMETSVGCADRACHDGTYDEWVAALGPADVCSNTSGIAFCDWQGGALETFFDDDDNDGIPDPGATAAGVFLNDGWSGANADGLALGISLRCYLEVWTGRVLDFETTDGVISEVHFDNPSVIITDADILEAPDGLVDRVSLFGP
ncbi:MAG: hypothetical protein ACI8PZ_005763, partial [Myxococcota bacterium]